MDDCKVRFCSIGDPGGVAEGIFLMQSGHRIFVKVKILASPMPLAELCLAQTVMFMKQHYKKETVEISKHLKFFKRLQQENKSSADYLTELRKLAKKL